MATELVTPDNVSAEMLRDLYEAAYMDVTLDEEHGMIRIREELAARAHLSESKAPDRDCTKDRRETNGSPGVAPAAGYDVRAGFSRRGSA